MKIIKINDDIGWWGITAENIIDQLDEAKGEDIEVHLASPGGSVFEGIQIYNAFRDYKRKYPEAQMMLAIKGLAASMASYIAVNPAFDLTITEDNAILMIHNVQGGAIGDYREMQKTADIFERLTDLLSKAYTDKTGISNKQIRELMDAETWYYGEEIFENGYVDEIIKTDKKTEKQTVIEDAKSNYKNMTSKFDQKIDIYKIAAMLKPEEKKEENITIQDVVYVVLGQEQNPADAGNNIIMEDKSKMTLKEFLEQNPAAKIEYDNILKEQFTAGAKSVTDRIEGAMVYLKGDSPYPQTIKNLAIDAIRGKCDIPALVAAVAVVDAMIEKNNSDAAKNETDKKAETPPQQEPQLSNDGKIRTEADIMHIVNQHKKARGMEVN